MEFSTLRVTVSLPDSWVTRSAPNGDLVATDVKSGRQIQIVEPTASTFDLKQPVSNERLAGSIKTMQAGVPAGYVVEKAGQIEIGGRLWVWWENRIPTLDTSAEASYQEILRSLPYRSGRTWSFTTTPQSQLVRVYLIVLLRGTSTAEDNDATGSAGAVFSEILRSMTFQSRK